MKSKLFAVFTGVMLSIFNSQLSTLRAQGSLTPPGTPAPTMKTLDQIEPRVPINATTTPADADSLFKITQSGSYYLTTNVVGVSGRHGIEIAADGVTLDLMGFSVSGVGGSLDGVFVSLSNLDRTTIRNGKVSGWGGDGVDVFTTRGSRVEEIQAGGNGGVGIRAGFHATVTRCISRSNVGDGILADEGSTVADCTSEGNAADGIEVDFSSAVQRCTALANGGIGIRVGNDSSLRQCDAQANTLSGIAAGDGCTIEQSVANNNLVRGILMGYDGVLTGCTARNNTADGISVNAGSAIRDCQVALNDEDGIEVTDYCLVRGNNALSSFFGSGIHVTGGNNEIANNRVASNLRGLHVSGTANDVTGNTVSGNTDNYDIAQGNQLNLLLSQIPESIDWPATVKLTGKLTGVAGEHGVNILADHVTLDLDGQALVGVPGSLSGVSVATVVTNLCIRNGNVSGWGSDGISASFSRDGTFADVRVSRNGGVGLNAGFSGTMTRCVASDNTGDGLVGWEMTITGCTASYNGGDGLSSNASVIENCTTLNNGANGIKGEVNSHISGCVSRNNVEHGIHVWYECQVLDNNCPGNGWGAGSGAGVYALGGSNRLDGNNVIGNDYGIRVVDTGNVIIRNSARGNTTANYSIVAGNDAGPIGSAATASSPWANISY